MWRKAEYHVQYNSFFILKEEFLIDSNFHIETLTDNYFQFQFPIKK